MVVGQAVEATRTPSPLYSGETAVTVSAATILLAPSAFAVSAERLAARIAGDGDVTFFLTWLGGVGVAVLVGMLLFAKLGRRILLRQPPGTELSVVGCMLTSLAIVCGALAIAIGISVALALSIGLFDTSSEGGPMEWMQTIAWLAGAATALLAAAMLRDRDARALLSLLAAGALLVAARESDLHEKLNSDQFGYWGVHYRRDWWLSADTPLPPRIVWAIAGLLILVVGGWLAWRSAIAVFLRGSPLGRLVWPLAAAAGLMVAGYALDDLLRYRQGINLRQSQVCEETLETAAVLVYLAAIGWGVKLGMRRTAV